MGCGWSAGAPGILGGTCHAPLQDPCGAPGRATGFSVRRAGKRARWATFRVTGQVWGELCGVYPEHAPEKRGEASAHASALQLPHKHPPFLLHSQRPGPPLAGGQLFRTTRRSPTICRSPTRCGYAARCSGRAVRPPGVSLFWSPALGAAKSMTRKNPPRLHPVRHKGLYMTRGRRGGGGRQRQRKCSEYYVPNIILVSQQPTRGEIAKWQIPQRSPAGSPFKLYKPYNM